MFILRKAGFAMKFLIPEDEFGVFADQRGVPRVDSLFVAATFEKQHYNVLRDIGRITASNSGLSPEFIALNFEGNTYRDARGRKLPRYLLTHHAGHGLHRLEGDAFQGTLYPSLQ